MPLEACIPEPNLLALTALPVARRGSVPPHVSRVRATIDALRHLVSMPLFYTNHRHFFRNLELLDELASSCTSCGSTLEWPAMILFGADLSELVSLRRIDTLSLFHLILCRVVISNLASSCIKEGVASRRSDSTPVCITVMLSAVFLSVRRFSVCRTVSCGRQL